ncbi:MAG TPA: rubrerythrin family protein [Candidatus Merdenecus merdavium]|nr:rubrerythrin family protein [Candidatus Merdenecus merdavium]
MKKEKEDNPSDIIFTTIDSPYPTVEISEPNRDYAFEILDNIGGTNSEMSAISLYFYNHIITEEYKEISSYFMKISMVEMHHLDIFGKIAYEFGANPKLWALKRGQMVYWTPNYNTYNINLKEMLLNAIYSEEAAIQKYESQKLLIKNRSVKDILARIILDEKSHVDLFHQLLKKYCI